MIVQTAAEGDPHFVITMAEHTLLAGALARHFGNDAFEGLWPRRELLFLIDHHDAGWKAFDDEAPADPETGLPYHLVETPFDRILETASASPEWNSGKHAFCGLLSSMHICGLYEGRYGLSEPVILDTLPAAKRPAARRMLEAEHARQRVLTERLAEDSETAPWIEGGRLFQSYKQLQFFDGLALYFNCTHAPARREATFAHVPRNRSEDEAVTVTPRGTGVYRVAPYVFDKDEIEVRFSGRYLEAAVSGARALGAELRRAPRAWQCVRLTR